MSAGSSFLISSVLYIRQKSENPLRKPGKNKKISGSIKPEKILRKGKTP
jgi:hypothetical protein